MNAQVDCAQAVAVHIKGLARSVARLESQMSEMLPQDSQAKNRILVEIQVLDRLRQSLEDLATIANRARMEVTPSTELKARLQLEQSMRLLMDGALGPAEPVEKGELDLF